MAYGTVGGVNALLGGFGGFTISASSTPSSTTVETWLDQYSSRLDSALYAGGYGTIPATGTQAVNVLTSYCEAVVALRTLQSAFGFQRVPEEAYKSLGGFAAFEQQLRAGEAWLEGSSAPDSGIILVQDTHRKDAYRDTFTEYDREDYESS